MSTGFRADWVLYRRLVRLTLRYWPVMAVLTMAVVVGAAMEPMLPALMKPLVDESLVASNTDTLWMVPVLLVPVVLLRGLADYVVTFCSQYLANRTVEDLRQALFAKELDLSLERHAQDEGGRMMTRITYDPQMVADAVSEAWMVLIRDLNRPGFRGGWLVLIMQLLSIEPPRVRSGCPQEKIRAGRTARHAV